MAFYVAPGVQFNRLVLANAELRRFFRPSSLTRTLYNSYDVYQLAIHQYAGLGFIFQYIPDTHAHAARLQFSADLVDPITQTIKEFKRLPPFINQSVENEFYWFRKFSYQFSLQNLFSFGHIFTVLDDIANGFERSSLIGDKAIPLKKIGYTAPIFVDIFQPLGNQIYGVRDDWLPRLMHSCINPFRLIEALLTTLDLLTNQLLYIGAPINTKLSFPRMALKLLLGIGWGFAKVPVKIAKHLWQSMLTTIKIVLVKPVEHVLSSLKMDSQHLGERLFFSTIDELRKEKVLRRLTKQRINPSYTTISKKISQSRNYIGITKEVLYNGSLASETPRLIVIRSPKERHQQTTRLCNLLKDYDGVTKITIAQREELITNATPILKK